MCELAMASVSEVWGKDFGQNPQKPLSSKANVVEKRDPVKEGRVASTPQQRSVDAVQRNRKTIDDLSKSLPIAETDDAFAKNYHANKVAPMASPVEHFGTQFSYAPPTYRQQPDVLVELLRKLEKVGTDTNSTQDMMLYIFTGIFFLFTLDTFVNLGKRMKRR
jgi:hypothetical protein